MFKRTRKEEGSPYDLSNSMSAKRLKVQKEKQEKEIRKNGRKG